MSIAQELKYQADLSSGTAVVSINSPLVAGDDRAQTFRVSLTENGSNPNLSNVSCSAYFVRGKTQSHDADTIPLDGEIVGSDAIVTLTSGCYTRNCYFALSIRLTNSGTGEKRTILIARGTVMKSQDGSLVDPDGTIPTLDDIFAQIEAMEAATDNANAAAEYANQAASSALNTTLYLTGAAAPVIIQSASGDGIVSVSDSAERTLSGMSVYGKTTQDGTPTPEAPVEMVNAGNSGSITVKVCGRNIAHKETVKQYPTNSTPDIIAPYTGKITLSAKPLSGSPIVNYCIRQNGQMTHTNWIKSTDGNGVWYNKVLDVSDFTGAWVYEAADGARTWEDVILSIGEVQMTDELYATLPQPQSMTASTPNGLPGISVSSGGNYIDANGQQWVCDEIDITRKVYVKRIVQKRMQNLAQYGTNNVGLVIGCDNGLRGTTVQNVGMSNALPIVGTTPQFVSPDSCLAVSGGHGPLVQIAGCTTLAALNDYLTANEVVVLCALKTPIETPLSPEELTGSTSLTAQYPNTTAFNDGGAGIALSYIADTKIYIDQRIAALLNA